MKETIKEKATKLLDDYDFYYESSIDLTKFWLTEEDRLINVSYVDENLIYLVMLSQKCRLLKLDDKSGSIVEFNTDFLADGECIINVVPLTNGLLIPVHPDGRCLYQEHGAEFSPCNASEVFPSLSRVKDIYSSDDGRIVVHDGIGTKVSIYSDGSFTDHKEFELDIDPPVQQSVRMALHGNYLLWLYVNEARILFFELPPNSPVDAMRKLDPVRTLSYPERSIGNICFVGDNPMIAAKESGLIKMNWSNDKPVHTIRTVAGFPLYALRVYFAEGGKKMLVVDNIAKKIYLFRSVDLDS